MEPINLNDTKKTAELIFLVVIAVCSIYSAVTLGNLSKNFSRLPVSEQLPVSVQAPNPEQVAEVAKARLTGHGEIIKKESDHLILLVSYLDEITMRADTEARSLKPFEEYNLKKELKLLVNETTYYPFKKYDELKVGDLVAFMGDKPFLENDIITAAHLYNEIQGL